MSGPPPPATAPPAATGPPYDLSLALGHDYGDQQVQWNKRDLIIYALSIGAHKDQFNLIYENDPNFQAFPLFGATLSFKGPETDVVDFVKKFSAPTNPIPGMPKTDPKKITQAMQFFQVLNPLPLVAKVEDGFKVTSKVVGIHENAHGIDINNELKIVGPDGKEYTRLMSTVRHLGLKANGTPFDSMTTSPILLPRPIASLGRPTWITTAPTWPEQSCLYRLNGDYNPLHIVPSVGASLGFGGLICHGLGMFGLTARAMLEKIGDNDPKALGAMCSSFVNPLTPGDPLVIKMWDLGPTAAPEAPPGASAIAFEAYNPKGNASLGDGIAYIVKTSKKIIETDPRATGYTGTDKPTTGSVTPAGVPGRKPSPFANLLDMYYQIIVYPAGLIAVAWIAAGVLVMKGWELAEVFIGFWFAPLLWIWARLIDTAKPAAVKA